jgi:NAD(P)-dependent dehydrogenase (short-subunit alcohol dehydrogenase family)
MARGHANRVAVITGAAAGLGQAFARRLAEEGVNIAIADLASPDETEAMVRAAGREVFSQTCDVASPDSVRAFAGAVLDRYGHIDILVNNAGIYPHSSFAEMEYEQWRKVLAVNLDSAFLMCKAFVPGMQERHWGRVVNVASNSVWLAMPMRVHYITSKAAVIGFTRALASEVGQSGVTVNAIAPGLTRTVTAADRLQAAFFEAVVAQQAINRSELPEDLVGTVAFLTSDDAAFITGQTIAIDGGLVRL